MYASGHVDLYIYASVVVARLCACGGKLMLQWPSKSGLFRDFTTVLGHTVFRCDLGGDFL